MSYVTPADMQALYEPAMLIQATNYSNRTASTVDEEMLQKACEHGNQVVDGYLLRVESSQITERLQAILKIHAARLAMDFLAGTDPQIREQAKETIEWLKTLSKLGSGGSDGGSEIPGTAVLPQISITAGRSWRVTF